MFWFQQAAAATSEKFFSWWGALISLATVLGSAIAWAWTRLDKRKKEAIEAEKKCQAHREEWQKALAATKDDWSFRFDQAEKELIQIRSEVESLPKHVDLEKLFDRQLRLQESTNQRIDNLQEATSRRLDKFEEKILDTFTDMVKNHEN